MAGVDKFEIGLVVTDDTGADWVLIARRSDDAWWAQPQDPDPDYFFALVRGVTVHPLTRDEVQLMLARWRFGLDRYYERHSMTGRPKPTPLSAIASHRPGRPLAPTTSPEPAPADVLPLAL